jgi:TusA-related sulfurtransferase
VPIGRGGLISSAMTNPPSQEGIDEWANKKTPEEIFQNYVYVAVFFYNVNQMRDGEFLEIVIAENVWT